MDDLETVIMDIEILQGRVRGLERELGTVKKQLRKLTRRIKRIADKT